MINGADAMGYGNEANKISFQGSLFSALVSALSLANWVNEHESWYTRLHKRLIVTIAPFLG
jgi:hypothetical protein